MTWKSGDSLTNTERRRVVPAPHGPGHAGDVGVALEESRTGWASCPHGHNCVYNLEQGACSGALGQGTRHMDPLWNGE